MTTIAESQTTEAETQYVELVYPTPHSGNPVLPDPFFTMFLLEQRRGGRMVTRAEQGIVAVGTPDLILLQDPDEEFNRSIADRTVELSWEERGNDRRHTLELQLLPSEARSLAAALIRGADLVDFPA